MLKAMYPKNVNTKYQSHYGQRAPKKLNTPLRPYSIQITSIEDDIGGTFHYRAVQPYEELFSVVQSLTGHPPHYERSHGGHGTNYEQSPYSNDDLLIKCFNSLTQPAPQEKNSHMTICLLLTRLRTLTKSPSNTKRTWSINFPIPPIPPKENKKYRKIKR